MRERADRDDIHPRGGRRRERRLIDAARRLDHRAVIDDPDRLAHHLRRHIIQHNDIRAARERLAHPREILHLDLDLRHMARIRPRPRERLADAARHLDMIILDEHRVVQPQPVIAAAAHAHRILIEQPQPRRRLPRIDQPRPIRRRNRREPRRPRRDPRHMLEQIQREPLARQHSARRAVHLSDHRPRRELRPVCELRRKGNPRLQELEHPARHRDARQHARILRVHDARRLHLRPHDGIRREIAAADILLKP